MEVKLLDRVRNAIRTRHYSRRTEEAYVHRIRRFIVHHGTRHPTEMGETEVSAFVSSPAARGVSASTQNQALSAVLFLYGAVLGRRLPWMETIVRAQRPVRLPMVLTRAEVAALLGRLRGPVWLMASLMYGGGLRLLECVELRVKDLEFDRGELTIRDGKGGKDRVTMLPATLKRPLTDQLARVKAQHEADVAAGRGAVALPGALRLKYPNAPREWSWQWVFPATRFYVDEATGERRRHHLHESVLQRAVKDAAREARITRPATCHSLRHWFATHLQRLAKEWSRNADGSYRILLAQGRELMSVTGITTGNGADERLVEFKWHWRATATGKGTPYEDDRAASGNAVFRLYDDGWRVLTVTAQPR